MQSRTRTVQCKCIIMSSLIRELGVKSNRMMVLVHSRMMINWAEFLISVSSSKLELLMLFIIWWTLFIEQHTHMCVQNRHTRNLDSRSVFDQNHKYNVFNTYTWFTMHCIAMQLHTRPPLSNLISWIGQFKVLNLVCLKQTEFMMKCKFSCS